jgi:3-oxoacyl-[acyl-carrier-protein] synthase I
VSPLEVIATGARTPLGLDAQSTAAAVRAAVSSFAEFPFILPSGQPVVVSADTELDSKLEGRERLVPMITSVLDEAVRALAQTSPYRGTCYLLLALPEARPGFTDEDAQWIRTAVTSRWHVPDWEVRAGVVGRGHAGAIQAIQRVGQESARGVEGLFLVVGADSYHHADTFTWLEQQRRFAQPAVRGGFIPGEGAACLVLASSRLQSEIGAEPLATLEGVGLAQERLLRDSDTGSFGAGMTEAVLGATAGLQLPREAVDTLYSDINGERYRSEEWGFVAMKTYEVWKSLEYEAPASNWGDVGAAHGTLAVALAVQSFKRRYARGPRALVMAGSDSGVRGAMLLQDPRTAEQRGA